MPIRRPKTNKNPPIFSHEFVIQNHADIVSCVAMVFVAGLMFQATSPMASMFVAMQHNVTMNDTEDVMEDTQYYNYGRRDVLTTFFYLLICVVVHAVVQEYVLDKLNRKMHLSKTKHSKFNESGQLLAFYAMSVVWGIDLIIRENYVTNISSLWDSYPHANLQFLVKFFFIIQIAYWLHCFPELYFQKIKKDEMGTRVQYACLYLTCISAAYMLNFTRVGLCMLVLHYFVEMVFHLSRLFYFAEKTEIANSGFFLWDVLFVLVRLGTITLAVLTFWYGLAKTGQMDVKFSEGNFNTQIIRLGCLASVCLLQAWMMWGFITFHLRRMRERTAAAAASRKAAPQTPIKKNKKKAKSEDESADSAGEASASGATENGTARPRNTRQRRH